MKKSLKFILGVGLSIVMGSCMIFNPIKVDALNNMAVSVGKNYGDGIDTRQDAIDASDAYDSVGYTTVTLTSPTKSQFTTQRLQADILFFSGHGCPNYMELGSNFYVYCQSGPVGSSHLNIGSTVQNQTLITFAGCNTAGGTDKNGTVYTSSITKRAANFNAGAAVGWTEEVSAGSHSNWLRRYNNALADGKSVSVAIEIANSYIYLPGSGVKSAKCEGDGSIKIKSSKSSLPTETVEFKKITEADEVFFKENYDLISKINELYSSKEKIYEDNELIAYIFECDKGSIVDVYFKRDNIITNIALTIQLNEEGKATSYKSHNISSTKKSAIQNELNGISVKRASVEQKNSIASQEQAKKESNEQVVGQRQFEYYDVTTKETYLVTYTTVATAGGAKYVLENVSLID